MVISFLFSDYVVNMSYVVNNKMRFINSLLFAECGNLCFVDSLIP